MKGRLSLSPLPEHVNFHCRWRAPATGKIISGRAQTIDGDRVFVISEQERSYASYWIPIENLEDE